VNRLRVRHRLNSECGVLNLVRATGLHYLGFIYHLILMKDSQITWNETKERGGEG
jgi:hypothetical protein